MKNKKEISRLKRHKRIRLKMHGTKEVPRLVVRRSLKNIFAQVVDDTNNLTLCSVCAKTPCGNIKSAAILGENFSKVLKEKGVTKIIFDRAGYLYHGRVKAFAEALRKGGLEF